MEQDGPAKRQRRLFRLFTALAFYIIVQSAWWAWSLVKKDRELQQLIDAFELRPERSTEGGHIPRTTWMVAGEGSVLLVLLLVALWIIYRMVRQELLTARRHQELLVSISHELRTPLAGVKLHLQTLERRGLADEERVQLQHRALSDVDRLRELTERLLLAARLDDADVRLEPSPRDLHPLVVDVVGRLRSVMRPAQDIVISGGSATGTVDPGSFISVVENLVENALKYGPKDGPVEVQVANLEGRAVVKVLDRGPGVAPSERERIFEKFHRSRHAIDQQVGGTGLGLYIVARLVHRMHGSITVSDRPGGGAIFAVSFPST